jgi:3-oxoacyl-ACP reductase-like protein
MTVIDKIKQAFSSDKPSEPTSTASSSTAPTPTTAPAPAPAPTSAPAAGAASAPAIPESEGVAFDKKDVTVIFVLGGPGAGTCDFSCP